MHKAIEKLRELAPHDPLASALVHMLEMGTTEENVLHAAISGYAEQNARYLKDLQRLAERGLDPITVIITSEEHARLMAKIEEEG